MYFDTEGYQVTRHVCPRNCYDTCGILAYVKNGKLCKVSGDPKHGYTDGKLCAKGYSYTRSVYSPDRIKYPMRQVPRGSGRWQRLSWDDAMEIICGKILELKDRYGSTLPLCLNKYSGNFGVLHYAAEGFFNSLGPTTQVLGSPCWSAGLDAQRLDMGNNYNSDPEEIAKAKLIILWGVNPAWTAIHSIPYIYKAQENGAKVIVIDPIYTQTARKADWFVQIKPGGDGALALAIAKVICQRGWASGEFLKNHTLGWENYIQYLQSLDLGDLAEQCGQKAGLIADLAELLADSTPAYIWMGFGMQRHTNGGQSVRAIDALMAVTGNIGRTGGGAHYANLSTWNLLKYNFLQTEHRNRLLDINRFAEQLQDTREPPVKMLWIACRNLIKQDCDITLLTKVLSDIELIVAVDMFATETAQYADLLLPAATLFECVDIVPSYWHHWLGINEQAIPPYYEAKSDLAIAQMAAKYLNKLKPGSSTFPVDLTPEELLENEFGQDTYDMLPIEHWSDLKEGPVRVNIPAVAWADGKFETPSKKFEFYSEQALSLDLTALPVLNPGLTPSRKYPFWLLTPHSQYGLNSQFQNLDWITGVASEPVVFINPETALAKGCKPGGLLRLYNDSGELVIKARISKDTPADMLVCYQGARAENKICLNTLIAGVSSDMGQISTGSRGQAFYDVFVDFEVL